VSAGCCDTPPGPLYVVPTIALRASRPWNVFLACVPRVKFGFVPGEIVGALPGAVVGLWSDSDGGTSLPLADWDMLADLACPCPFGRVDDGVEAEPVLLWASVGVELELLVWLRTS
jgi:hypothetical protein